MLNINNKLSKKGFSLIELMVAVVILVLRIYYKLDTIYFLSL